MAETTHSDVRVTFVGQSIFFEGCVPETPFGRVVPTFVEFRSGDDALQLNRAVAASSPEVVIVFRPETIPEGALASTKATKIGWFTEPLPYLPDRESINDVVSGSRTGVSDAEKDLFNRLSNVARGDYGQFDRFVSHDPHNVPVLELFCPIWRSLPLPVADHYFREPTVSPSGSAVIFIGRSTAHREHMLGPLKHDSEVRHFAHGLAGDELSRQLANSSIAINLHCHNLPNFENRVPLHLAQGQLVFSEPLTPTHGLEPNRDFVEVHGPEELCYAVSEAMTFPTAFELIRLRGRMKAEYFRASRVLGSLVQELLNSSTSIAE